MKNICFLTCQDLAGFVQDDSLAIAELEKNQEYKVSSIAWDDEADWSLFDLVIIRTTWDYTKRPKEFLKKLEFINTKTKLLNAPEVIHWNHHKAYLKELEAKGINIVPTQMFKHPGPITIPSDWKYDRFIVKPAISATAFKTMIVPRAELQNVELFEGDWLLQPFMEVISKGEISLIFFNKKFSHATIKIPKAGDFRVQEEHGGDIKFYQADDELLKLSQNLVDKIPFDLLYGRVDLVLWEGAYRLMELELIEPSLYFRTSPGTSVKNFKAALDKIFTTP